MRTEITPSKVSSIFRYLPEVVAKQKSAADMLVALKRNGDIILPSGERLQARPCGPAFATRGHKIRYYLIPAVEQEIPSGEYAESEDELLQAVQTPSGTELLLKFEKMDRFVAGEEHIRDAGSIKQRDDDDEDEDDDDDEDEDGSPRFRSKKYIAKKSSRTDPNAFVVTPQLYFQFLKSRMTSTQLEDINSRLAKLNVLIRGTELTGQTGLYESLCIQLSGIVREQEAAAIGCNKKILRSTVEMFIRKIEGRNVLQGTLEEFPRPIPADIATRIAEVRSANVFDRFELVYIDYTGETVKATATKIREKDPILFGIIEALPEYLYPVVDWVDEYCDITLDKIIETIRAEDSEFTLPVVEELTQERINKILKEVDRNQLRLKQTNPSKWRRLMREQEDEDREREEEARKALVEQTTAEGSIGTETSAVEETPAPKIATKSFFHQFLDSAGNFLKRAAQ